MEIESKILEYKKEYVEDIKKTIIAFANTEGGKIIIGVNNDLQVVGVSDIDNTLLKITHTIRDSIKPDITMFVDYKTEKMQEKDIVIIKVQKATACPYYLSGKGIRPEGVFVRQGASTAPASETAILKMIKDSSNECFEELRSLNQELSFEACKNEFELKTLKFEPQNMKTLNLIGRDDLYTNLALLLSDQCTHSIKAAIFEGSTKEIFKDRIEFNGSIFTQLHDCFDFIERNVKTNAKIQGLTRIENRDYPQIAIREILLNALIHRDYSYSSSILISIFDDRMEFVTVGGLAKGFTKDDIMLGVSMLRNKNLSNVFYRLHLIEAYGTGFGKIYSSYEKYKACTPLIETTDNAFKITIYNTNFKTEEITSNLTFIEQTIIDEFKAKDEFKRADLESSLGFSQQMAIKHLKSMVKKDLIIKKGAGKNTSYTINSDVLLKLQAQI